MLREIVAANELTLRPQRYRTGFARSGTRGTVIVTAKIEMVSARIGPLNTHLAGSDPLRETSAVYVVGRRAPAHTGMPVTRQLCIETWHDNAAKAERAKKQVHEADKRNLLLVARMRGDNEAHAFFAFNGVAVRRFGSRRTDAPQDDASRSERPTSSALPPLKFAPCPAPYNVLKGGAARRTTREDQ